MKQETIKSNTEIGIEGENTASDYLINKKYRIIHRNFHIGKIGEIDIIAEKKSGFWPFFRKKLVFVEVKTIILNKSYPHFSPENKVNLKKQTKLRLLAELYLKMHRIALDTTWQIDVIALEQDRFTGNIELRHHENAIFLE